MGYGFWQKFGIMQGMEYEKYLTGFVKAGKTAASFNEKMQTLGMGRRKTDYLVDYRRAEAIELSKSIKSKTNAATWFDQHFEPLRAKHGWNSVQTTDFLRRGRFGELDSIEEIEEYEEYLMSLEEEFPDLYPVAG